MRSPDEAIDRVLTAIRPRPPLKVDEWQERYNGVILPARGNARAGPVDLTWTPYLRQPLRDFTDRGITRLGLCFGRQCGKTTFLFLCMGFCVDHDPGPLLLYYPTEDIGKEISKDRIKPLILASPRLRRHMTARKEDFQTLSYTFDTMTIRYGHAGSEMGGRSKPIRYLFKDETSGMGIGAADDANDTTTSFWNRRILETSTPKMCEDNMWRFLGLKPMQGKRGEELWNIDAYEPTSATTVMFYYQPCPRCGKLILFHWRQLRWPDDCAIRDIPQRTWYECQECGGSITDSDKPWMRDPANGAQWLPHPKQRDEPRGNWVGYWLGKMWGPWVECGFGRIARDGLRARNSRDPEKLQKFVNNSLALPYSIEQEAMDLVEVDAIVDCGLAYHRNTIPEGVRVLTIGIDVGKATGSRVHWIVQGFGASGRSWRISWGIFDDLYAMETYIRETRWQHPQAGPMAILLGAADSRWNKPEVIRFCKVFRDRIFPVSGERHVRVKPGSVVAVPWKVHFAERDEKGRALPGSIIGYRVNTVYWKQWLYGRINCRDGQDRTFFFPIERDEALERHLSSEEEYLVRRKGFAEIERAWRLKQGYEQNHYLDATIYGVCIADVHELLDHREKGPIMTGVAKPREPVPESEQNPMGFTEMRY